MIVSIEALKWQTRVVCTESAREEPQGSNSREVIWPLVLSRGHGDTLHPTHWRGCRFGFRDSGKALLQQPTVPSTRSLAHLAGCWSSEEQASSPCSPRSETAACESWEQESALHRALDWPASPLGGPGTRKLWAGAGEFPRHSRRVLTRLWSCASVLLLCLL